jgi:hypothetical protein
MNGELPAFCNCMLDIFIFWALSFTMRIFRVDEPMVVNTVSNKTESCEKRIFAEELVMILSFLQEKVCISRKRIPQKEIIFLKLFRAVKILN